MANITSVNISTQKGTVKHPVAQASLRVGHGVVGDAHAGDWHRQVSLLAEESIDTVRKYAPDLVLSPGMFAENLTTEGITLHTLPIGTKLQVGETVLEITQIGKECHLGCAIREQTGDCVMPREGVFAMVVREGTVHPGDTITILEDSKR